MILTLKGACALEQCPESVELTAPGIAPFDLADCEQTVVNLSQSQLGCGFGRPQLEHEFDRLAEIGRRGKDILAKRLAVIAIPA